MSSDRKQLITSIFHSAIEREGTERAAFLDGACANDAELRREVESLIRAHEDAGDLIDQPAYVSGAEVLNDVDGRAFEGRTIGPYKIISLLGAGGMGEVYRAHDSRLGREVALKVLPHPLSRGDDSLRRFQQEARAASALNHPNILSIFDTGTTDDGIPFVVSELLEGETLREKLAGGALPLRKAIDYALQTTRGLAAAHGKGIVHRDLKPENLFVTKDGRLKILDFGIAKLVQRQGLGHELHTEAPTMIIKTDPGMVIGTVGYMSPEQVRGQSVDTRSDIFSFGAILYELLSGRRAFQGDSQVERMNAILKEEPADLTADNNRITPAVERVVRRCLEKQAEERFQSASDLAFALESLSSATSGATAAASRAEAKPRVWSRAQIIWAAATLLLAIAALGFAALYFRRPATEVRPVRLMISSEKLIFTNIAVSPDGRLLAIAAQDDAGERQIYLRPLDSLEIRPLAGTEGGRNPFWSPDGRFVAFFTDDKLKKVEAAGGPVQIICDAGGNFGASWGRDGTILFVTRFGVGVSRVASSGGAVTEATKLNSSREEFAHLMPYFLPDGRNFLFKAYGKKSGIMAGSLDTGETKWLERRGALAGYSPTGHLLFAQGGTLFAQAYDPKSAQLSGEPVPVAEGVGSDHAMDAVFTSVSETGVLAYLTASAAMGKPLRTSQISVFDRAGKLVSTLGEPGSYFHINVSPDGSRLAFDRLRVDQQGSFMDVWTMELSRGVPMRLTFDPLTALDPVWSPDGTRIAYMSDREGLYHLYVRPAGGAGEPELLLKNDADKFLGDWATDGRHILYVQDDPQTGPDDVWALPLFGDRQPFPVFKTKFNEMQPSFSPDGRFVAYVSNESGRNEVYVQSFPTSGFKLKISTAGGTTPVWRRDGQEMFYVAPDGKLMAAEITPAVAAVKVGVPAPLFQTRLDGDDDSKEAFAVLSNGARFVIINPISEQTSAPINIVLNWEAHLKR
jgi:serine/threonine protein kinase/Tol biopolymer transport system component